MSQRIMLALFACLTAACGVEAGNPTTTDPKVGTASIYFAQSTSKTVGDSLLLALSNLQLSLSGSTTSTDVTPSTSTVELYNADSSQQQLAATASVPAGIYSTITLRLADDKPVHYKPGQGDEHYPDLENSAHSIVVAQTFTVTEGSATQLVINLDPDRSLVTEGGKTIFKPLGHAQNRERGVNYDGTGQAGDTYVCAYLYEALHDGKDQGGSRPPPPDGSHDVAQRPVFGNVGDVTKDTTASCPNAFARVPVLSGKFSFHNLAPGTYDFRIFMSADAFRDGAAGVQLKPIEPVSGAGGGQGGPGGGEPHERSGGAERGPNLHFNSKAKT